jgi:hypothetical protein
MYLTLGTAAARRAHIPSSFLRLVLFPVGRLRRLRPSAGKPLGGWSSSATVINRKEKSMDDSPSSWEAMYRDEKYSWFWPPAYDSKSNPPEIEAVVSLLGAQPGTKLLDLACGQGWLTIPLAQCGFHVTGFDLSAECGVAHAR